MTWDYLENVLDPERVREVTWDENGMKLIGMDLESAQQWTCKMYCDDLANIFWKNQKV